MSDTLSSVPTEAPPPSLSFGGYGADTSGLPATAGFGVRTVARLIDIVVHYMIAVAAGLFLGIAIAVAAGGDPAATQLAVERLRQNSVLAFVFSLLGSIMYHTVCESLHGSTLGKMICGVVVLDEGGKPCGFLGALSRSAAILIDGLVFGLVAYMAMKGSPLDQRKGDEWGHTIVAKRKAVPATSLRTGGRFAVALLAAIAVDAVFLLLAGVAKFEGWG